MRRWKTYATGLALPLLLAVDVAAVNDDFEDGVQGPMWTLIEDAPARLSVEEQNGRLEALATPGGTINDDALYLSNGPSGFSIRTDSDFEMQADFHFGSVTTPLGAILGLTFGMGTGPGGEDSFSMGYGFAVTVMGYGAGFRVNDAETLLAPIVEPFPEDGTFYVSYDTAIDAVYLSRTGYGAGAADFTLPGLVQGTWGADELLVAFGARGSNLTLASGDAWIDDFQVVSGVVVPEPGTAGLLGLGIVCLALRRRR